MKSQSTSKKQSRQSNTGKKAATQNKSTRPNAADKRGLKGEDTLPPLEFKDIVLFLNRFGYIQNVSNPDQKDVIQGLKRYQAFHGLPITGKVDEKTEAYIRAPRCGIPDIRGDFKYIDALVDAKGQAQGQALESEPAKNATVTALAAAMPIRPLPTHWPLRVKSLTFYINTTGSGVGDSEARAACKAAFDAWSTALNPRLTFIETTTETRADILVLWINQDPDPMMTAAIAHSDFPEILASPNPYRKPLHFDQGQTWTIQIPLMNQHDIQTIALHEIGHLVGFEHAIDEPDSVMWDVFNFNRYQHALSSNDIASVRFGYQLP